MEGVDQRLAGEVPLETAKLLGCEDDDFVAPVNGDMLGPLVMDPPHQFAEARLCVLQRPAA